MHKHWHFLQNDCVLGPVLPPKPQLVFRGVPSLKDKIAHNILDPSSISPLFHNLIGYYKCGHCQVCGLNKCKKRKNIEFSLGPPQKSF